MTEYLPPGMVSFSAALARSAEAFCPEAWASAKPETRSLLADGTTLKSTWVGAWAGPNSLAEKAYAALRPLLADGRLPASLRMTTGAPEPIEAVSWQASGADRIEAVLKGAVMFIVASGAAARGDVLIAGVNLDAVLAGKPVPPSPAAGPARVAKMAIAAPSKAGRRPNPDVDSFWIEVCRLVADGGVKGGQAGYTERMAQWAAVNMDRPYDAETIRKKLGSLFKALGWG